MEYVQQPAAGETALKYAQDVLSGSIVACKYVKLACKRFLDDLQFGESRGIYFDVDAAQHAVDFFGFLRHVTGAWARKIETSGFVLAPWQVFIVANLFGWMRKDTGQRRFREAHLEVARKNGKSTFLGGIGLYMLFADGEPGAEVYSAATTKDQARRIFDPAKAMTKASPFLKSRIGVWRNNLHVEATNSKFEPLASDSNTLDGLNIHCGLIDELHEHPDRSLYDVLNTATGSRTQPLILAITTAGFTREGICWDQRVYGIKVVSGITPDDNFFAFIATLDEGDDWQDEKNWIKANPNLGVSVSIEAIRPNFMKAKEQPAAQNEFLRKHLNVWTAQETAWLPDGCWEKNTQFGEYGKAEELRLKAMIRLRGRLCFGGLDLASTDDLVAFALFFPPCDLVEGIEVKTPGTRCVRVHGTQETKLLAEPQALHLLNIQAATELFGADIPEPLRRVVVRQEQDKMWHVLVWFWIADAFMEEKARKNRAPYDAWVRAKFIEKTPGNEVAQEAIRAKILELNRYFRIHEIGYDKWNAGWLGPKLLEDGIQMVKIPQQFEFLDAPTKHLTALLATAMKLPALIEHYCNPVLRWMASNVQLLLDSNGNQRPDKGKSKNKIDGIVALLLAVARYLANPHAKSAGDPDLYKVRYI